MRNVRGQWAGEDGTTTKERHMSTGCSRTEPPIGGRRTHIWSRPAGCDMRLHSGSAASWAASDELLVVNVNTTASMTEAIAGSARSVAAPGTEIVGLTPALGAESVEGNFESYLAAVAVMGSRRHLRGRLRRRDPGGLRRARPRGAPGAAGRAGASTSPRRPAHVACLLGRTVLRRHHPRPRRSADRGPPPRSPGC